MKTNSNISQELLETVERYLNDTMTDDERNIFEVQIQNDNTLKTQVEELKTLISGIENQALRAQLEEFHKEIPTTAETKSDNSITKVPSKSFWNFAAAAIIIIALGSFWFLQDSNEQLYDTYFTVDPGLPTTMSSSDNFAFFDAMVNYKQGDYKKAISKWEVLEQKSPENDTINYFLGVAHLADKNAAEAIPYLNKTVNISTSVFLEDAYFYLGLAYLKANKIKEAKQAFQKSQSATSKDILNTLK